MDRDFMIRRKSDGTVYCSRCGKRQLDLYNMKKHAAFCGFDQTDISVLEEERSLGYRLEAEKDALVLSVCRPALKTLRGFTDRFRGIGWTPFFEVRFPAGQRRYQVVRNEGGFDMKALLSGIGEGSIVPVHRERDSGLIRSVFPGVVDVYSPLMFVHIYGGRGFSAEKPLCPAAEKLLFGRIPEAEAPPSPAENAAPFLYADLFRYRKEACILRVIVPWKGEPLVFLFTRGYASCSRDVSLREVLDRDYCLTGKAGAALRRFDREYPEYLLGPFMERSENVLVPLLAPDYHTGMELAAKAGAAGIAQSVDHLSVMQGDPEGVTNLKKAFGLPSDVLRSVNRSQACDAFLGRMKEIWDYNPAFLRFPAYTHSMAEFFMRADLTKKEGAGEPFGIRDLTDRQILQILRYLEKHPDDGPDYLDYLRACRRLGDHPYGLTPDIPVREAFELTAERLADACDVSVREAFLEAVGSADYRSLATGLTREDRECFEEEPYVVRVPESAADLDREGRDMHNCVRTYIPYVAGKRSRICFLRRKAEPEKSFVTLEVSPGGELIQAKAFANSRPCPEARQFLRRWCSVKKLKISTCDLR